MELIGIALGAVFWPMALLAWLVAGYFAIRKYGRPARIVRNVGGAVWLALVALVAMSLYQWLFLDDPLVSSACNGDLHEVRSLLGRGASPNACIEGSSAIMMAVSNGHTDVVRALLDRGADPNVRDNEGRTALALAKDNDYTEIVQMLKSAGAKEGRK